MTLARAWVRQLLGASGIALLVPGALVCALIALAFAGGFSRFGSIGQALSGPASPSVQNGESGASRASDQLGKTLVALGNANLGGGPGIAGSGGSVSHAGGTRVTGVGGPDPGVSQAPGHRPHPGKPSGSGHHGGTTTHPTGGGPTTTSTPTTASTTTTTPTAPSVADKVVTTATGVTSKIPGAVGSIATGALQAIGGALDHVLPPPLGQK